MDNLVHPVNLMLLDYGGKQSTWSKLMQKELSTLGLEPKDLFAQR